MITDYSSAKFRDVILKVNQKLGLFVSDYIIEMNVLVTPLKVMNDTFISQLFLNNEDVLEEINNSLFDIEMVEFGNHCLLVLQVSLICINESISLVNHISNIIKNGTVSA